MTHTWDIYLRYYICPKCQKIIESREDKPKELECQRCHEIFTPPTPKKSPAPLLGKPTKPEFLWE